MKKYIEGYFKGLIIGLGIITVMGLTGIAYGAYVSLTDVTSGATLTSSLFNQVLENQRTLKATVDSVNTRVVPTGFVGAFNLSTCPTGRIPANGTNGTPDLRGEFIRGLDNGRGVDPSRGLGTLQRGSLVMNSYSDSNGRIYSLSHQLDDRLGYDFPITDSTKLYYRVSTVSESFTWGINGHVDPNYAKMTRPRNVALLYCVKQ